jgi:hypothetical protein
MIDKYADMADEKVAAENNVTVATVQAQNTTKN